jgi:hypothetical protein
MMHGRMHCLKQITINVFKVEKRIASASNNSIKTLIFEMRHGWRNVGWCDVKMGGEWSPHNIPRFLTAYFLFLFFSFSHL